MRVCRMKIVSLMLLRALQDDEEPSVLCSAYDVESFGYFQRASAKQFALFVSKTVAKRVDLGQRSCIEHEKFLVYVHLRSNGLAGVAVCDEEYPQRVAFSVLMKLQDEFLSSYDTEAWMKSIGELPLNCIDEMIKKYQNPQEADAIMRIQRDLDDTKVILHKTIDSVLERGVKLDNLVEKSTDLSTQSKMFYKTAKKQNSCCGMM